MLDLVVVGGTVVTGHTPVRADIGVKDGRIAVLSAPGSMTGDARETLEAFGRFVVPGGIDAHVHFDLNVTEAMRAQSAVDGSRAAARPRPRPTAVGRSRTSRCASSPATPSASSWLACRSPSSPSSPST